MDGGPIRAGSDRLDFADARGCRDAVLARAEALHGGEELERVVGPQRGVLPVAVDVPALAAAVQPHRAGGLALNLRVPSVLRLLARFDRGDARAVDVLERLANVSRLRLRHQHHRRVTEASVRAE